MEGLAFLDDGDEEQRASGEGTNCAEKEEERQRKWDTEL